jgi:CRP/FNR family transcriptional regulator, cyclic AMP receptor protein
MIQTPEVIDDLRVIPCLSGLNRQDLTAIQSMANLRTVPRNSDLFFEGDPVDFFFVVKDGLVKLYKGSQDGRELLIRRMGPGDYFCCAPLYTTGMHYVSGRAVKESVLVMLPAAEFKCLMSGGVSEMGQRMIRSLCSRIRYLSELVEDLTFKNVEQRIMITLWRVAEESLPSDPVVHLSITHHDIASMIGTVREVVSRTMLKLKKEGIIAETGMKGFKVDKEKLLSLLRQP